MTDWCRVISYEKHASVKRFPATSFLLSAVSFHQDAVKELNIDDTLELTLEPNKYDSTALVIKKGQEICGYVPKDKKEQIAPYAPSKVTVIEKRLSKKIYSLRVDITNRPAPSS